MFTVTLYLSFFLRLLLSTTAATNEPPYSPSDYFLLNCGSSSNTTSTDGRNWEGDARSKFSPSNMADTSSPSSASEQHPSVTQVPFMTARIIHSDFTYTFPVSAGPKFLRLYFYPATYSTLHKSESFFSVNSGNYNLLTNFSAFLTVTAIKLPATAKSLVKEFIVNVKDNQKLNITFSPSPNSYAFINGIEIISIPDNLYMRGNDYPVTLVNVHSNFFYIDNNTAFETLHRLNVGGNAVQVKNDSGMFRSWIQDDAYVNSSLTGVIAHRVLPIQYTSETPAYTAPEIVYATSRVLQFKNQSLLYNLTWVFPVDPGFYYLLRLHFCEVLSEITLPNQRVFTIFINNQTALLSADVIRWTLEPGIPVFKDYVVWVEPDGRRSKKDLWLALYPYLDDHPMYADAILNGIEIFKLNRSDGSLAGINPELEPEPAAPAAMSPERPKNKGLSPLVIGIVGGVGGIAVVSTFVFLVSRRRRRAQQLGTTDAKSSWDLVSYTSGPTMTNASTLPSDLCRRFSLAEIKSATGNFDDNFVIGTGGFGNVYKGCVDNGATTVAIKRLNPSSSQGAREFQTEIGMLSKLRHLHLVSLIGYCDENGEMILVYDYMAHGTLRDHLYKTKNPPLSWKQRLQICIGAARGLHYLHTGAKRTIIHRDVKSTNILLDEKWVAKVSDFGLSKLGPKDVSNSHVSTAVKGSFGYVDPEYYRRQQLTEKSDVYSFGVVLFEVLCGRPAIVPGLSKEEVSLAGWARSCYKNGTLDEIIDPHLRGEIAPECLRKFGEIADSCLRVQGIERPAMNDVVWNLEFALQLQEAAARSTTTPPVNSSVPLLLHGEATTTDDDDVFSGSGKHVSRSKSSGTSMTSSDGFKSQAVFSEIFNPAGR